MELLAIADKKAAAYVEVVRKLNDARQRSLEYKVSPSTYHTFVTRFIY